MNQDQPPEKAPTDRTIVYFEDQEVRRLWDEEQEKWYFSIVDIIGVITGASIPKRYWADLKKKLNQEGFQPYEKIVRLKMTAPDGKKRDSTGIRYDQRFHATVTFQHTKYWRLAPGSTTPLSRTHATDVGFVTFHDTAKEDGFLFHEFSNLKSDTPGAFVGYFELAL